MKRGGRKGGRHNVLTHKLSITLGGSGAVNPTTFTGGQLQMLNRPAKVLQVRVALTSVDPRRVQLIMYNSLGEEMTAGPTIVCHKNIARLTSHCPQGTDYGVYLASSKVFEMWSDATSGSTIVGEAHILIAYAQPFGANPAFEKTEATHELETDFERM